jgi:arsenate reductase
MNLQLYMHKRNFDTQKAERFLKERRIAYTIVDMKKRPPAKRELALFANKLGARALIDLDSQAVKGHPIAYTNSESIIIDYLLTQPAFLRTPILRDGQRVLVGFDETAYMDFVGLNRT